MNLVVLSDPTARETVFLRNVVPAVEDALADLPGATLVSPSGSRSTDRRPGRPQWLSAIRTTRRADWVFWIQYHLRPSLGTWALAYAKPLARRAILAIEQWERGVENLGYVVQAQGISTCFVVYRQAYLELRRRFPLLPIERLRLGFSDDVFFDRHRDRDIYAFSMGRRYDPLHEALLRYCRDRGLVYRYSRWAGDPPDVSTLNELISRARYFVVTPPDLGDRSRTGAFSPITSRYLEGPAGGSRLLGVAPRDHDEYAEFLPEDALVECEPDGSDLPAALERADADPRGELLRTEVRDLVHREHTWRHRAHTIYRHLQSL